MDLNPKSMEKVHFHSHGNKRDSSREAHFPRGSGSIGVGPGIFHVQPGQGAGLAKLIPF